MSGAAFQENCIEKNRQWPEPVHGLQFADSCSRMAVIATILFWNISGEGASKVH